MLGIGKDDGTIIADDDGSGDDDNYKDAKNIDTTKGDIDRDIILLLGTNNDGVTVDIDFADYDVDTNEIDLQEGKVKSTTIVTEYPMMDIHKFSMDSSATNRDTDDDNESNILYILLGGPYDTARIDNATNRLGINNEIVDGSNIGPFLMTGMQVDNNIIIQTSNSAIGDRAGSEGDKNYKDAKSIDVPSRSIDADIILLLGQYFPNNGKDTDIDYVSNVNLTTIETGDNKSSILNILLGGPNDSPRIDNSTNILGTVKEIMNGSDIDPIILKGIQSDDNIIIMKINSAIGAGAGSGGDENNKDAKSIDIPSRTIDTDIILLLGKFDAGDMGIDYVGNVNLTEIKLDANDLNIPGVTEISTSLPSFDNDSITNETNDNHISLLNILLGDPNKHRSGDNGTNRPNRTNEIVGGDKTELLLMKLLQACRSRISDLIRNNTTTKEDLTPKDQKHKDPRSFESSQHMTDKTKQENVQIDSDIYLLLGDFILPNNTVLNVKPIQIGDIPYDVILLLEDNIGTNTSSMDDKNVIQNSGHVELKGKSYPYYPNMYYPP